MLPFMVIPGVDIAAKARSEVERRGVALADGVARHHAAPDRAAAGRTRHPVRLPDGVRPLGERVCNSGPARRTPLESGGDLVYDEYWALAELAPRRTIAIIVLIANLLIMLTYNRVGRRDQGATDAG